MPNRILKESIRTSKAVNEISDMQFRLWAYLITYVDDYGRASADTELIKGLVFPRRKSVTESTIKDALSALASKGLIRLYEADGESYLCFPKWSEHQRIQNKKSKCPAPPEDGAQESTAIHGDSRWITVTHGESPPESNLNPNPNPNPRERRARAPFTPPTQEEATAYFAAQKGTAQQAEAFMLHYQSNGWLVGGKSRMVDWRAAARKWILNDSKYSRPAAGAPHKPQDQMLRYSEQERRQTASAAIVDFEE